MLATLIAFVPAQGQAGAAARTAIGDTRAHARQLCTDNVLAIPLNECFTQARLAGVTWQQIETVRRQIDSETPTTLGGTLVKNSGVRFCLATIGRILSTLTFVSRNQVEALKTAIQQPFLDAEEIAADDMSQAVFQALITLHGALTNHLVATALPLPRMLGYQFYAPLPSLVMAYKLYDDASRADELRAENHIVHPAFMLPSGLALSA
jgi:hypothetical protein